MKDGHFKIKAHITSGAFTADLTGEGTLLLKPKYASSFQLQGSLGAIPIALQEVVVDGQNYTRIGSAKWTQAAAQSQPGNIGSNAQKPKLVSEETLSEGKSWHIQATDPTSGQLFDTWIRESDGYLVKYSSSTDTGTFSLEFDKYNVGTSISAPPQSEIKPAAKNVTGQIGTAMALNGVTVTVVTANLNAASGNQFITPKSGDRFVAVQILYEDTGSDPYDYNQFDWKLTDSSGFSYDTAFSGIGPELHSGTLQPGERARGYVTYEVPVSATGLKLKVTSGDDSASVPLD